MAILKPLKISAGGKSTNVGVGYIGTTNMFKGVLLTDGQYMSVILDELDRWTTILGQRC